MQIFRPFVPLVLVAALAGCAAEGSLTPVSGAGPVTAAKVWSIEVTGAEPDRAQEIRNAVLEQLIGSSLAQQVVLPGVPADRLLTIKVIELHYVSSGARMMLGALAGRNVVKATETLRDANAPVAQTLKVFTIDAESGSHPLGGEAMFDDALKQFGQKTMDGLRG